MWSCRVKASMLAVSDVMRLSTPPAPSAALFLGSFFSPSLFSSSADDGGVPAEPSLRLLSKINPPRLPRTRAPHLTTL